MYILKRILMSLHSAVFPRENFVKILLLYENPSVRQFPKTAMSEPGWIS